MRRFMEGASNDVVRTTLVKPIARPDLPEQPRSSGAPPKQRRAPSETDYVDPALARNLIKSAVANLTIPDPEPGEARPSRSSHPKLKNTSSDSYGRAQRILDPDIYQAIKAECPGWDLDVLMQQFDTFLNANPGELPRNYSKRFFGFVKRHHERNRFQISGN